MLALLLVLFLGACPPAELPAESYCEESAETFCAYYLRCGLMAVEDRTACLTAFEETCTEVYLPHYVALAEEDRLALRREGLAVCADHLEEVACEEQVHDLQGPCAQVWAGLTPAGGPCAPGIGSFVCDEASTCVLGLDLCGTCEEAGGPDAPCGEGDRCQASLACVEGVCVPRALPGEPCSEAHPCLVGTWCEEGTCARPEGVGVGEACDATRRCPYKSACVAGTCVESGLLGEPCGEGVGCASGWCDDGTCTPRREEGAACGSPDECVAGVCREGACGALPGACFE